MTYAINRIAMRFLKKMVELTGVEPVSKNSSTFEHLQFSATVYKTAECTVRKTSAESDRLFFVIPVRSLRFTLSDFLHSRYKSDFVTGRIAATLQAFLGSESKTSVIVVSV